MKFSLYLPEVIYEKVKRVSEKEGLSMSTLFKVSFIEKYEKIYPEIIKKN